jgi:hypothetical protein
VLANDLKVKDYQWSMTNIASKGLNKETLFSRMDRDFIKTKTSICSNRALMWANDFKQKWNLDTAKVFLFYTEKKGDASRKTWWYHVAPVINENGDVWVMDAGFPRWVTEPMTIPDWLEKFSNSTNCKEISANETDLVELMFSSQVFPSRTAYGRYDCYYKIVPQSIWTPDILAQNLLGKDSDGRPVQVERHEIDKNELYQACVEATASKIGWALGSSKAKCKEYVAR